jgi:C1A family cysteine protease
MCWAFGTVAALENSVLRDESPPTFWKNQILNVSELFLGVNTHGAASYCDGGDFYLAISYINATN